MLAERRAIGPGPATHSRLHAQAYSPVQARPQAYAKWCSFRRLRCECVWQNAGIKLALRLRK